jgi:hypothetical protein
MLTNSKPEDAKRLWKQAQRDAEVRYQLYEYFAQRKPEPKPIEADKRPSEPLQKTEPTLSR